MPADGVAVLSRTSSSDTESVLEQYAQAHDLLIVRVCQSVEDLLVACREGIVDTVLAFRLAEFGTTVEQLVTVLEGLRQFRVAVISLSEGVMEPTFFAHVALLANIQREMAEQRTFSQAEGPLERRESLLPTDTLR